MDRKHQFLQGSYRFMWRFWHRVFTSLNASVWPCSECHRGARSAGYLCPDWFYQGLRPKSTASSPSLMFQQLSMHVRLEKSLIDVQHSAGTKQGIPCPNVGACLVTKYCLQSCHQSSYQQTTLPPLLDKDEPNTKAIQCLLVTETMQFDDNLSSYPIQSGLGKCQA